MAIKTLRTHSRLTNSTKGRIFLDNIKKFSYTFITPDGPTYWLTHQNCQRDTLDFFLTSIPNYINHNIQNSCNISSDYTPVILEINTSLTCKAPRPPLAKVSVNWIKFSIILENNTNFKVSLKTTSEIE